MTDIPDAIDAAVPLAPDQPTHALRRQRQKVVDATQGSHEAMFAASVEGIGVTERLFVALHACRLSKAASLADQYRARLIAEGADKATLDAIDHARPVPDERLRTVLAFTATLIERPIDGDREAVQTLVKAGLSTPAIVALGQLIAYLSYQVRVVAGLQAMAALEASA